MKESSSAPHSLPIHPGGPAAGVKPNIPLELQPPCLNRYSLGENPIALVNCRVK